MLRYKILVIVFTTILHFYAWSQEMAGLVHSNYAGTDVLFNNPAGMHHQKDWLSIHLITTDIFLSNDYLYLSKDEFRFSDLLTGNINLVSHPTGYSEGERPFYIYDRNNNTRLDLDLKIQGPSAMFIKNEHAFGLFTAARTILHIRNITPELGRVAYYGFGYVPQHDEFYNIQDFNTTFLSYGEIGLSYAYQWNQLQFSNWNFGISIKS